MRSESYVTLQYEVIEMSRMNVQDARRAIAVSTFDHHLGHMTHF